MKIELPNFHYFHSKNPYSGSVGNFRYRLVPEDDLLKVTAWPGVNCMDATDPELLRREEFPLTKEGEESAEEWLLKQFQDCKEKECW